MELEIIERDVKITPIIKKCERCKESYDKMHYIGIKNTYYCIDCYNVLDNIDSVLDIKFKDIEKRLKDNESSLLHKNSKLVFMETKIAELDTHLNSIVKLFESLNLEE